MVYICSIRTAPRETTAGYLANSAGMGSGDYVVPTIPLVGSQRPGAGEVGCTAVHSCAAGQYCDWVRQKNGTICSETEGPGCSCQLVSGWRPPTATKTFPRQSWIGCYAMLFYLLSTCHWVASGLCNRKYISLNYDYETISYSWWSTVMQGVANKLAP